MVEAIMRARLSLRLSEYGIALAIVVVAGIGLRLWDLDARSLWLDEAYSKWYSALDLAEIWSLVPQTDSHPPLYYSLLRGWRLMFGDSVFALRLPSAVAGCALMATLVPISREISRLLYWDEAKARGLILVGMAFVALSPLAIVSARQARSYSVQMLFYSLALYSILRIIRTVKEGLGQTIPTRIWLLYFVSLEMILWLHSLGAIFAFCLSLALLASIQKTPPRQWLGWFLFGHGSVLFLYIPCLIIIGGEAQAWQKSTWLIFSGSSIITHYSRAYGGGIIAAALITALAAGAAWTAWRNPAERHILLVMLFLGFAPFVIEVLLSWLVTPVLLFRTLAPVIVPVALAIGILTVSAGRTSWQARGSLAAATLLLTTSVMLHPKMIDENWAAIAEWIDHRKQPGDEIWAYPNDVALPLNFALTDKGLSSIARPVPTSFPALDHKGIRPTGAPGVVSASASELRSLAESSMTRKVKTIWLVRQAERYYDPNDEILAALSRGRHLTTSIRMGTISVYGYTDRRLPLTALRGGPAGAGAAR